MRLGCLLKTWRSFGGITVRDVAESIGVSPATITRLENGKGIDSQSFIKIISWLAEQPQTIDEGNPVCFPQSSLEISR